MLLCAGWCCCPTLRRRGRLSAVAMVAAHLDVHDGWLYCTLAFAACMGVGLALFNRVENPLHRWLSRRLAIR